MGGAHCLSLCLLCILGSSGGDEEGKRGDEKESLLEGCLRIQSLFMKVIISSHGLHLAQKYLI